MNPKLSVIVPVYNGEKYLERLISSIEEQQFDAMEVLLIDDGSTDRSWELCLEYQKRVSWIRAIHTENGGVSRARNRGLDEARGEWVQFIDVDDTIEPGMFYDFARQTAHSCPDIAVCGCVRSYSGKTKTEYCGPSASQILEWQEIRNCLERLPMEDRYWMLDYVWNKWYKRAVIEEQKLRFEETLSLGEDFVFNAHYFCHVSRAALIEKPYYHYCINGNGLVSRFRREPWAGRQTLFEAQKALYQAYGLEESSREWMKRQAGQIAFGDLRTVSSKKCPCTFFEKLQFVRGMIQSEQYELILVYLKSRRSPAFFVYYCVTALRNAALVMAVISLEEWFRRMVSGWKR